MSSDAEVLLIHNMFLFERYKHIPLITQQKNLRRCQNIIWKKDWLIDGRIIVLDSTLTQRKFGCFGSGNYIEDDNDIASNICLQFDIHQSF